MTTQFDGVIVCVGMVGEAIAVALAQGNAGLKVAILDPAYNQPAPNMGRGINDYGTRVSALSAQSQTFLTGLGAWQKIPQGRLSPYTGMNVWDSEGTGSVTFDAADLHVPALGHIVENNQTQWALRSVIESEESIQVFADKVRYFDSRQDNDYTPRSEERRVGK